MMNLKWYWSFRGTTTYTIHHLEYSLSEGDVLIVDGEDLHRIRESSRDILMLRLHVDLKYFEDQYPHIYFMIFACEDCARDSASKQEHLKNKVVVLRKQLCKIAASWFSEPDNTELQMENLSEFVFLLVNHFQNFFIENKRFKTKEEGTNKLDLERIYRIFEYIYDNHSKKITLKDLGELEHLSPYYISHMLKETTGMTFQDFLSYLRVELAQKMLLESDQSLTYISETCGFSSLNYFNKCFKYWHGITPSEFRKNYIPCRKISYGTIDLKEAKALVLPYLGNHANQEIRKPVHIFISLEQQKKSKEEFKDSYSFIIMISSGKELLAFAHLHDRIQPLGKCRVLVQQTAYQELVDSVGVEMASLCLKKLRGTQITPEMFDNKEEITLEALGKAENVAEAFYNLMDSPDRCIALFGKEGALFTKEAFSTPYYMLFSVLSKVNGKIMCKEHNYFIVQSDKYYFLGIHNSGNNGDLRVHLECGKDAAGQIIKHTFNKSHSCFASMEALEGLDFEDTVIRETIENTGLGEMEIVNPERLNKSEFNFELDVHKKSFILLKIPVNIQ